MSALTAPAPVPQLRALRLEPYPGQFDPTSEPPVTAAPGEGQQQLPLEFCLPNGLPAVPRVPTCVSSQPSTGGLVPWAGRLAQAVLEVVAAERPVSQLTRWVVPEVYRRLERRHQLRAHLADPRRPRTRSAEQVRSVHLCHPRPDVAEVTVVTSSGERCRAMALRLEHRRNRWLCTALDWA